ncbi:CDP-alcohol phosphatidyltransferase family protein [Granulosicoccus antarcticus]|uniref:Inner membrane protein YnjF n=1 Tax=Granulosicoccus antarcticus IMCC3135 TaxID=1192854 RepID=A0A2Z2P291_9GAMM|nr:CDP-alcohol phosphatidyltransferase family protein [Granulosicoccus antarcticus]ASJ76398.1 Inner membrane protein YnjF [Granulosicoccus antarcticus IMCC3135]
MLDKYLVPRLKPHLRTVAVHAQRRGLTANRLTVFGFVIGVACVPLLALGHYKTALIFLLLNRLADGLDGEVARLDSPSDAGGYLDITLDFVFYAVFPLGFALADPLHNALPAAVLIASFVGTGASFLAFAIQAQKHSIESPDFGYKSLYYLNGLAEGTETILCFALMCLFPAYFPIIAWSFAALCLVTAINRIYFGFATLK